MDAANVAFLFFFLLLFFGKNEILNNSIKYNTKKKIPNLTTLQL